jgi:predicted Zn-dependent protease with MMP-like domain
MADIGDNAPTIDDIAAMAEQVLAELPAQFRDKLQGVGIMVEERADPAVLRRLGLRSPWQLLGLYSGVPLPHHSISDTLRFPERIFLYREPILLEWQRSNADLFSLVRHVLIHEIAHHFGFSDEEIELIEEGPD